MVWVFSRRASLNEPQLALALGFGFMLVLTEFTLLFWRLYGWERAHRGLTLIPREYLRLRVGLVFDALAPLIAGALILLAVVSAFHAAPGMGAGDRLLMGAIGVAGVALGVLYIRRGQMLPRRALTLAQPLQQEVQRMGRELNVPVRELLVLDGTRVRMANAFALSGGRIAITDYLLSHLTEREALAVLAHEIAHLAQRRRLWRLWLLELGAAWGLMIGTAPLWQRMPAWSHLLLLTTLIAGMAAPMRWLRRRHELQADAFAVSQYGADAMQNALRKVAALRGLPRDGTAGIHPDLQQRLAHLERLTLR